MKLTKSLAIIVLMSAFTTVSQAQEMKTSKDSLGYAIGFQTGEYFFLNQFDFISLEAYLAGFEAGFKGNRSSAKVRDPQYTELLKRFQSMAQQRQQENQEREASFNKFVTKDIMEKNIRDDKDVKQTESGLQYKVLVEGKGPKP